MSDDTTRVIEDLRGRVERLEARCGVFAAMFSALLERRALAAARPR